MVADELNDPVKLYAVFWIWVVFNMVSPVIARNERSAKRRVDQAKVGVEDGTPFVRMLTDRLLVQLLCWSNNVGH